MVPVWSKDSNQCERFHDKLPGEKRRHTRQVEGPLDHATCVWMLASSSISVLFLYNHNSNRKKKHAASHQEHIPWNTGDPWRNSKRLQNNYVQLNSLGPQNWDNIELISQVILLGPAIQSLILWATSSHPGLRLSGRQFMVRFWLWSFRCSTEDTAGPMT